MLEYLKKKSEAPPVIMITAKEGAQHKVYAEYLGVVDYLNKPFPIEASSRAFKKAWHTSARRPPSSQTGGVGQEQLKWGMR